MTTDPGTFWGSDVPISMPEPTSDTVLVDMGAHGFSLNGLVHNLTQSDLDDYLIPTFAPTSVRNG